MKRRGRGWWDEEEQEEEEKGVKGGKTGRGRRQKSSF